MPETRRRFDPEFRAGAVRIVLETGKPIAAVARDLGIHAGTLGNWVKAERQDPGEGRSMLTSGPSWCGCGAAALSWRWSAMCSNDPWSCG